MKSYSSESVEYTLKDLNSSTKGLSENEVNSRLQVYGLNEIKKRKDNIVLKLIINQFSNFLVIILVIAAIISYFLNDHKDFFLIIVIVILNSILGFIQEYRSEKAVEALKKLSSLKSRVIRDDKITEIDTKFLVPGDIILFEEGSKIPADARIIESINLETQESSLTGESMPIEKTISVLDKISSIADQKNMVFSSTIVTRGRGKAIVTSTGMNTEIGRIAKLIGTEHKNYTPLQNKLNSLGKKLGIFSLIICFMIMITILYTSNNLMLALMLSLSLAVAAIPEGLPALVTISLALGIQRMSKKNAIIRKLPAVETLGSTNVIVSDKTGTLTKNEMTVKKIYVDNSEIEVNGSGYNKIGSFSYDKLSVNERDLDLLLSIGVICNNSDFNSSKNSIIGDPTEASLLVSASKVFIEKEEIDKLYKRIKEISFDSKKKYMATINEKDNKESLYVKGAPDVLLKLSSHILINGKKIKLDEKLKQSILDKNHEFSNNALRVLGFAYKENNVESIDNLTFIGLQAMIDPPRDNIREDIEKCYNAGIKVKIVTGDYIGTAIAIGNQIGISGKSIAGEELEKLSDDNLSRIVEKYDIYARVNPEHKLRIVKSLQNLGYVVAVTGDGINDAPALKKADIGIAMGISGTDVSKEAADMILKDDNFHSIVNAVEEGRIVYSNIQKFVTYMFSVNSSEILIILLSILLGWNLPLLATQILFINLITDGLPALALSIDPPSKDVMSQKPKNKKGSIITKKLLVYILLMNLLTTFGVLGLFDYYLNTSGIETARTVAFTLLVVIELLAVYLIRSLFDIPIFSKNRYLNLSIFASFMLQLLILYSPLKSFLDVVSLSLNDWLLIIIIAFVIAVIFWVIKKIVDSLNKSKNINIL